MTDDTTSASAQAEREQFEAWLTHHEPTTSIERDGKGYRYSLADTYWDAWQARAAIAASAPTGQGAGLTDAVSSHIADLRRVSAMLKDGPLNKTSEEIAKAATELEIALATRSAGDGPRASNRNHIMSDAVLLRTIARSASNVSDSARAQLLAISESLGEHSSAGDGQAVANNDEVICPSCTHQFRAIPVNVQRLMLDAGFEPPFTAPPPAASVRDAQDALAREAVEEFKRRWMRVPPFGNRVNKATREAILFAHCPIVNLPAMLDAERKGGKANG